MSKKDIRFPWFHGARFFSLLFAIGFLFILFAAYFSLNGAFAGAKKELADHIDDLKKQCNDYNDFLSDDEAKSLIRLTEQAENLSTVLTLLTDAEKDDYIEDYIESQRLTDVYLLDEDLTFSETYSKNGSSTVDWTKLFKSPAVSSVATHKNKIFALRTTIGGSIFDVAAVSRKDATGIVFCAVLQDEQTLETHFSSVKNLLAREETSLRAKLFITKDEEIIASNSDDNLTRKSESDEITSFINKGEGFFVSFKSGGEVYYGGNARFKEYDVFVFLPQKAILSSCSTTLLLLLFLYVLSISLFVAIRARSNVYHVNEMNKQYEIIKSISSIYVLVSFFNLTDKNYKLIKYPSEWGKIPDNGPIDENFLKNRVDYVENTFKKEYADFIDFETIKERLNDKDYIEIDYRDKYGKWMNDKIIPQNRDENNDFKSCILVRKNIDAQKTTELEYQNKLEKAVYNEKLANQSKSEFLRRMSHDIRTPINVILGMLELADRNDKDYEFLKDCRAKCRTATEYLLELVNEILVVNRIDGGIDGNKTPTYFNLYDEVRKTYVIANERSKKYSVVLEPTVFTGDKNVILVGEPLYLRQIMINLISNAVRYSADGKKVYTYVDVSYSSNRNVVNVRFTCVDNGIGMSKEFQKKMFEPFAQEGDTVVGKFNGIGLGLSIVKKLVDKLNGTVSVESEKGQGTRFDVVLPYVVGKKAEQETAASVSKSLKGLTVMIVEDNELNMEIAEYCLADAGAKTLKAYNGKEAVDGFSSSKPYSIDAILTDLTMPVLDGIEEAKIIRSMNRPDAVSVPIIAMTANLFDSDIEACKNAGMTDVLSKPLGMEKLVKTIYKHVKNKKAD